jgi:hypothetical protein
MCGPKGTMTTSSRTHNLERKGDIAAFYSIPDD